MAEARLLSDFFGEPQGAAVLKHEVLRQYLRIYGGKTGSRTGVVLVDGYAGPGRYADESPGSPELMVKTVRALRTENVHCIFVERNRRLREQLKALLVEELGDQDSEVVEGRIEERLEPIVQASAGKSLLSSWTPSASPSPLNSWSGCCRAAHVARRRAVGSPPRYCSTSRSAASTAPPAAWTVPRLVSAPRSTGTLRVNLP